MKKNLAILTLLSSLVIPSVAMAQQGPSGRYGKQTEPAPTNRRGRADRGNQPRNTPPVKTPPARAPRNRWQKPQLEAIVSGFAVKNGSVVISGSNFPTSAVVTVAGKPVAATISSTRIRFDARYSGFIMLKAYGKSLVVGNHVVAAPPPRRERREEIEKRAQERVKGRWVNNGPTRSERQKRYEAEQAALEKSRAARARAHAAAVRAQFERAFLASAAVQTELAFHAERNARLTRMRRLAELEALKGIAVRIEVLMEREDARHEQRMAVLRASFTS